MSKSCKNPAKCLQNLTEALLEDAQMLEDQGGFIEQRQVDQHVRDVRLAVKLLRNEEELGHE